MNGEKILVIAEDLKTYELTCAPFSFIKETKVNGLTFELFPTMNTSWAIMGRDGTATCLLDIDPGHKIIKVTSGRWLHVVIPNEGICILGNEIVNIGRKYIYDMKSHHKTYVDDWPVGQYSAEQRHFRWIGRYTAPLSSKTNSIRPLVLKGVKEMIQNIFAGDTFTNIIPACKPLSTSRVYDTYDEWSRPCPPGVAVIFIIGTDTSTAIMHLSLDPKAKYKMSVNEPGNAEWKYIGLNHIASISGKYMTGSCELILTTNGLFDISKTITNGRAPCKLSDDYIGSTNVYLLENSFYDSRDPIPKPSSQFILGRTLVTIINYKSRQLVQKYTVP